MNPSRTVPIRTMIIDDHPLARRRLRALLDKQPDVEVVGECRDGQEAVAALRTAHPDLVFLDVQMPELDGFGVLRALRDDAAPLVIFVTAYDQYALDAFDVHALDYLMKPFNDDRFHSALGRARQQFQRRRSSDLSRRMLELMRDVRLPVPPQERLMLRTGSRILFVDPRQIVWVEAEGNYLRLFLAEGSYVMRGTMKDLEARISKDFLRIHRSHAVNVSCISELRTSGGDLVVVLEDGTTLKVGQNFRDHVEQRMRII
jgi:two-component system LytT family response regulator